MKLPFKVPRSRPPMQVNTKRVGKPSPQHLLTKKVIECPACEGTGKNPTDITKDCGDCTGKGKVSVTIQR